MGFPQPTTSGQVVTYLPTIGNGTANDAGIFNALTDNAGTRRLSNGDILCQSPIVIPKYTRISGYIATTDTGVTNGIQFDPTTIMVSGNAMTIVADGVNWVITLTGADGTHPHGLVAGNTFTIYGCATAGFNIACKIASVTTTTLTVANTTVPAANDTGSIAVHLIRLGSFTDFAPATMLEDCYVECNSIPGSIAVYSNTIQEMAGLRRVTMHHPLYRGILVDSSDPAGTGRVALNYLLQDNRCVLSPSAIANASSLQLVGSNVACRGVDGFTATGGGATIPDAQIRIDGVKGGVFKDLHVEKSTVGVLIGHDLACVATSFDGVLGNAACITAVKIDTPASGTNTQLLLREINPNGSTNSIVDAPNGNTRTSTVGEYRTDVNGAVSVDSSVDAVVAEHITSDVVIGTALTTIDTITLPLGRHIVTCTVLAVPGATTTAIEAQFTTNTAVITTEGVKAASVPISGTQPVTVTFVTRVTVTTAGTVRLRAQATTANANAKALSPTNSFANVTGMVAVKAP